MVIVVKKGDKTEWYDQNSVKLTNFYRIPMSISPLQ